MNKNNHIGIWKYEEIVHKYLRKIVNIITGLLVSEGDYAHIANGAQALESGRIRLKS